MTNFKDLDFLVESLRKVDTGKNHILITGNIKVGKSTLLKAFIKKYYKNHLTNYLFRCRIKETITGGEFDGLLSIRRSSFIYIWCKSD